MLHGNSNIVRCAHCNQWPKRFQNRITHSVIIYIPNLYDFLCSVEHKWRYFEECWSNVECWLFTFNFETFLVKETLLLQEKHWCVSASFQGAERILLYLYIFMFQIWFCVSICPSVYTVMTLANSRCAANQSVLNRCFLMLSISRCMSEKIIYGVKNKCQKMKSSYLSSIRWGTLHRNVL